MKKYDGILKRVREIEEKKGIHYAKTDGKLYKTLSVFYLLFFIWTLLIDALVILSFSLNYGITKNKGSIMDIIVTVSVCTVALLAGYIFNRFKFYLTGGILSVVSLIFSTLVFANQLKDGLGLWGFQYKFYWRHLGPAVIMVILMIVMTVIAVRARVKTDKQYKLVTDNLFNMYNVNADGSDVTEEQWQKFLAEYDHNEYKQQFKKQFDEENKE